MIVDLYNTVKSHFKGNGAQQCASKKRKECLGKQKCP